MNSQYQTTTGRSVILMPIGLIRPHEHHKPVHADQLRLKMLANKYFTHPICLDRETLTLLDGHHRFRASQALGFDYVPCILVNYWSSDITVTSWRNDHPVTRHDVLAAAKSLSLMPIKTSRHKFKTPIGECSISIRRLGKSGVKKLSERFLPYQRHSALVGTRQDLASQCR